MSAKISIKKIAPEAVMPSKALAGDVGYDLTIISRETIVTGVWHGRVMDPEVTLYDTGVAVEPSDGYYVEVVPRSSLSRTGYIMANSIGIIDPSYRGTIKVALIKIDKYAPEIPLPFKGFQMVIRKIENVELCLTDENLSQTTRGNGGFGSTNALPSIPRRRPPKTETRNDPTASALPLAFQLAEQIGDMD